MMATGSIARPVNLFYSYAHEDEPLREELRGHLKILERRGLLASWHDRQITVGEDWHARIDAQLQMADLVLLLVSKDFIDSDYIFGTELTMAMQRHQAGLATVVPIMVRAIHVEEEDRDALPFLRLQGLPTDLRPVTSWPNRDEAWTNVAKGLRATVKAIHEKKAAAAPQVPKRGMRVPAPSAAVSAGGPQAGLSADPLLRTIVDAFTSTLEAASARRGGGPVEARVAHERALRLIDLRDQKRILWVDDHPEHNQQEIAALAKLQIEVETARAPAEALAVLADDAEYDLVISDWGRGWEPDAGLRLLREVRAAYPRIPVIYYHGEFDARGRAARARQILDHGGMGEAVYPSELFGLIESALSRPAAS